MKQHICKFPELSELLFKYIRTIKMMEHTRGSSVYKILEEERIKIHDEILKLTGHTRESQEFQFALASFVESILSI